MTQEEFIEQLVRLKYEAGRLGLWRTMHALDPKYAEAISRRSP